METEENIAKAKWVNENEEAFQQMGTPDDRAVEKARNAAKARARTAQLRALGLSARGKPLKDRHKNRDAAKQRRYQANYGRKHKAARKRLGLTITEFQKLPRATRLMELNYPTQGKAVDPKERNRQRQREWYHKNKGKAGGTVQWLHPETGKPLANGVLPTDDRTVRFCPHCGWNIDATRKAQAFVDGRGA
jgi:hypothetical protein